MRSVHAHSFPTLPSQAFFRSLRSKARAKACPIRPFFFHREEVITHQIGGIRLLRYLTGPRRALAPRLYEELRAALCEGEESLFVLVPEQYTLEAERELMDALHLPGSFRLQVLSPGRLCRLVFEQAGYPQPVRIDERGRVMLLHDALGRLGNELTWYRGAQHRRGFTELAAHQIKEFKQAGQTPETLLALPEAQGEGALAQKLRDLARIWTVYEQSLAGRFMDGEDEVLQAVSRMPDAPSLRGARIWAHGFELVSQTLGRLLVGLCTAAREVTLLLGLENDEQAPDSYVYQPVRDSLAKLDRLAAQAALQRTRVPLREESSAQTRGDLLHLEWQLYAYPCLPYAGRPEHVRLMLCETPLQEAMAALAWARRLSRERGWRYREMAIVLVHPGYEQALRQAAELYRIELFLPENRSADRHPLAQYLLSSLRLIARGWQEEEMLLLMRTGYSPLSPEEADRLSNYATIWSLSGRAWLRPLTQGDFEAMEPLRARLTQPLLALEEEFRAADGNLEAQLTALWNLLTRSGAYQRLLDEQTRLQELRQPSAANESTQVWNRIVGALDQLHALLSQSRLSADDLYELLSQSLGACEIKPLPQSGDALVAGALNRLRGHDLRAVIFLGCAGGEGGDEGGLFQPAERQALEQGGGLWLSPDAFSRTRLGALDLKAVLSLAQEEALFLYSQSAPDGTAVQPGALIGWVRRALPEIETIGGVTQGDQVASWLYEAPEAAFYLLPTKMSAHTLSPADAQALRALRDLPEYAPRLEGLRRALRRRTASEPLGEELARRLYGGVQRVSVTRLETFAACPFRHFAQYGLRPERIQPLTLDPQSEGTFFHQALESFLREASLPITGDLLESSMDQMDRVTEQLLSELMDGALGEDPILRARGRRLRCIARRAARTAAKHLAGSRFEPLAFELSFGQGRELTLKTCRGDVPVEGRIDRIDLFQDGAHRYLRVIDYKSGNNQIDLVKLYWGLQLQLIVYLAAALKQASGTPAGVFYFHVQDPPLRTNERNASVVEQQREDELRLRGLFLNDPTVLEAMSPDFEHSIALQRNKDGSVRKCDNALQEEDFSTLVDYSLRVAAELTEQILAGRTDVAPARITTSYDACRYCDFLSACQMDERVNPVARRHESFKADEALQRMRARTEREE